MAQSQSMLQCTSCTQHGSAQPTSFSDGPICLAWAATLVPMRVSSRQGSLSLAILFATFEEHLRWTSSVRQVTPPDQTTICQVLDGPPPLSGRQWHRLNLITTNKIRRQRVFQALFLSQEQNNFGSCCPYRALGVYFQQQLIEY